MNKGVVQKALPVKDDEKYLEGINLVTGDKIDYTRHILTETQISALCVNEKISKVEKFMLIMINGEKIQKWSMFENMTLYIENVQNAEKILGLLETNYAEYEQFLSIMGQGCCKYLIKCEENRQLLNGKCLQTLYRLILRTIIAPKWQGSQILGDWMSGLGLLFHVGGHKGDLSDRNGKLGELIEYINGSFSMNTLPERRKTALEMIDALFKQSHQVESQSHSKILFFNNDLNPSTRMVICRIMEKIVQKKESSDIWKCILDYYSSDKSFIIRQKALEIISENYFKGNVEHIFQELDNDDSEFVNTNTKYLPVLFKTYEKDIKQEPLCQLKIFSFLNRLLRKNTEKYLATVVKCYEELVFIVPETVLIKELELKKFPLECQQVICELIKLQTASRHIEFKEELKKTIFKGLRYHEFYIKMDVQAVIMLLDMLELDVDEDIGTFILMLGKQIQSSKWKNIQFFLQKISQIRFTSTFLEKAVNNILKLYSNCPYFMLQMIHKVILHLLLIDRKGMEIYVRIREKCLGSKNWMLRRNFIKLYTYFKTNASYEFNKSIMPLVYKNIVNEKNVLIKLEFVREFIKAYSFFDPTIPQEKVSIKECITRFSEDRDRQLAFLAQKALEVIKECDKDVETMNKNLVRNKELNSKEVVMEQVIQEQKKHVKTQKLIGRTSRDLKEKPIKRSMVEAKTIVNLTKIDRIQEHDLVLNKPSLIRSNSTQKKKQKSSLPHPKKTRFHG